MKNKLLLCLLIGSSITATPLKQDKNFKPHMLNHSYEGCPTNSRCTQKVGQHFKRWLAILKQETQNLSNKKTYLEGKTWPRLDKFRKKYGIPLEVWSFPSKKNPDNLIYWDSPCEYHNKKDQKVMVSLALAKDLRELQKLEKKNHKIMLARSLLLEPSGKTREYLVPRGMGPLYLDGESLVYTKENQGLYYGIRIKHIGKISVTIPALPQQYPKTVSCPDPLVKKFAHIFPSKKIYQGVYCQNLWNNKSNRYQTMIFGWSCH